MRQSLRNILAFIGALGCCAYASIQRVQAVDEGCPLDGWQTTDFVRAVSRIRYETHKIRPKLKRCETFVERIRLEQNSAVMPAVLKQNAGPSVVLNEISKILEPRCSRQGPVSGSSSLLEFVGDCLELIELSGQRAQKPAQEQSNVKNESAAPAASAAAAAVRADKIEEIIVKKDSQGRVGMVLDRVFLGSAFVFFIKAGSPAARAGFRFGDQVVAINGLALDDEQRDVTEERLRETLTYSVKKTPFEQTISINAREFSQLGFELDGKGTGKVLLVETNSPAACAGLQKDAHIITINGKYVIGFDNKEILRQLRDGVNSGSELKLTVIPSLSFDLLTQRMRREDLRVISEESNKILAEDLVTVKRDAH